MSRAVCRNNYYFFQRASNYYRMGSVQSTGKSDKGSPTKSRGSGGSSETSPSTTPESSPPKVGFTFLKRSAPLVSIICHPVQNVQIFALLKYFTQVGNSGSPPSSSPPPTVTAFTDEACDRLPVPEEQLPQVEHLNFLQLEL